MPRTRCAAFCRRSAGWCAISRRRATISASIPASSKAPCQGGVGGRGWVVCRDAARHPVTVTQAGGGYAVMLAGATHRVALDWRPGKPVFAASIDGRDLVFQIDRDGTGFRLTHGGGATTVRVLPPHAAALLAHMPVKQAPDLSRFLLSPMPGLLVGPAVAEGQAIKVGEVLATVEAMKMENVLRAERDGTVAKIRANIGDSLAVDEIILEFA